MNWLPTAALAFVPVVLLQPLAGQQSVQEPAVIREARAAGRAALASVEAGHGEQRRGAWLESLARDPDDLIPQFGLAALDRYTYRPDAAERRYLDIVGEDSDLSDPARLFAALGLAKTLADKWQLAEAEAWFERVAGAALAGGMPRVEAAALIPLAVIKLRSRGADVALRHLDRADSIISPADTLQLVGAKCQRGRVLAVRGTHPAVDLAEEGAALARAIGQRRMEAGCLFVKVVDYDRRGLYLEAFGVLREVEALETASRDLSGLAGTQQVFGQMLNQYGLFGPGMDRTELAIRNAEASGNRSAQAWAAIVLAYMAVRLDDPVVAMAHVRVAEALLEQIQDLAGMANLRAVQGDAASLAGEMAEARRAYAESSELAQIAVPAGAVHLERRRASMARRTGDLDEAARRLATADSLANVYGAVDHLWGQSYEWGLLAMARGEWGEAERHFVTVLDGIPEAWYQHQNRFDAQARLAEVLALRGDLAGAAEELGRAFDHLDGWRSTFSERQFRLSVLHTQKSDWDRDLGIARVLGELARVGEVEAALVLSERQRSRVLLAHVTRRGSLAGVLPTEVEAPEEPTRLPVAGPPDEATGEDPTPTTRSPAFDPAALIERLPPGTALLSYVTDAGGDRTTAFLLSTEGTVAFDLEPADSLKPDIARLTTLLESGVAAASLARRLGSALLDSVVSALPADVEALVVVPDGPLHRIPFDALVLSDGRRVLERFVVTIAPSASFAAAVWAGPPTAAGRTMMVFGNPLMPGAVTGTGRAEAMRGASQILAGGAGPDYEVELPPLPGSAREARAVSRYSRDARVLIGASASEAALKTARLEDVGVLHFATHAVVAERSLLRTALVLAPGDGEDGFVYPHELAELGLDGALVVLSACRTAAGPTLAGEGVQGLTAPLLEAGAQAVVASHWPLGDRSAIRLTEDFYSRLADGAPAAVALRGAKLESFRRGDPASVWAALTLVGDGRVLPALTTPPPIRAWLAAVFGLLLLAYGGWRRRRRALR